MFKFCPSVHNVPNGQHITPNIRNTMTCIGMIANLENSSIMFTSTCKVLIQTEFNVILRKCLVRGPFEMSLKYCYVHINTILHTSAHIADYAHNIIT